MMKKYAASLAIVFALTASTNARTFAARATKAKPVADSLTRWLGRYAATRTARAELHRLLKDEQLHKQFVAAKSEEAGHGAAVNTILSGFMLAYGGLAAAAAMNPYADDRGFAATIAVMASGVSAYEWSAASRARDLARGDAVRFALANGFKVSRVLLGAMKQSGRFGQFDRKSVAAFKLHPSSKKGRGIRPALESSSVPD
jgi:hypothetical protein